MLAIRMPVVKNTTFSRFIAGLATTLVVVTSALFPLTSHASLKCQELVDRRTCADSSPRTISFGAGTTTVAAPILSGYSSACWTWARTFQCVESNPTYACDSGTPFNTVKADCSLTAAQIASTVNINGVNYITSANYAYQCAYGEWTTNQNLPTNKQCVLLDSTTTTTGTAPAAPIGSDPATTPISGSIDTSQNRDDKYVCYGAPVTTCSDTCFANKPDPVTGVMTSVPVPCTETVTSCTSTANQCNNTVTQNPDGTFTGHLATGPDGRCVDSVDQQMCQAGTIPKCLQGNDNCQLTSTTPSGIQANGSATQQDQTYTCSNQTETCTELTNVSNCVHEGAWGWDQLSIKSQVGEGLGEYNEAMSKLDGLSKGLNNQDPYIFSGQDLRCHYAIGNFLNTAILAALAIAVVVVTGGAGIAAIAPELAMQGFAAGMTLTEMNVAMVAAVAAAGAVQDAPNSKAIGSNCCKDYVISGSDAWYKLGSCTADEIKLSVAKQKGLYHYIGEYCSKKSGFPIKQCVEKTRTYCVFDDMLALVVNEQGRQQLDDLANADPTSTKTTPASYFQFFDAPVTNATKYTGQLNTGHWQKQATENNSQVWTWVYPGYCASTTAQTAAYTVWENEVAAATNLTGIQPDKMTKDQAAALFVQSVSVAPFQECAAKPGTMSFLTCSKEDDSCDPTHLPESPDGVDTDTSAGDVSNEDVNWRIQQADSFYKPGDYGVTATMPTDATFGAVSTSVNDFISAVGSCHAADGKCLYYFAITDKIATNGLGAKKRATEYAQFPLYTALPTSAYPAVKYVSQDGTLDMAAYQADPNRGLGDPTTVSNQRLIFHPLYAVTPPTQIGSKILVEYANQLTDTNAPQNDYQPLMVPTSLPQGTPGWFPYGDQTQHGKYFYLSGGCDANSRWCNYEIDVDLDIPRHPWGSPQSPACWGFTLEQLAALDFNKMDLSKWINSLDLSSATDGLSADAAKAMTDQVTKSAQAFYSSVANDTSVTKPGAGTMALVTNTDVLPKLSNDNFSAYVLTLAVPSNWPNWFDDQPNNNPTTNVMVNWGDGKMEALKMDPGGKAWTSQHDYGDDPVAGYTITVTLNTGSNGPQTLTTNVSVTPDQGDAMPDSEKSDLNFNNPGSDTAVQGTYTPSDTLNGLNQSPNSLDTISPATADQFKNQGNSITVPAAGSSN
jgi:hypothetical protein